MRAKKSVSFLLVGLFLVVGQWPASKAQDALELVDVSITELQEGLSRGDFSSVDLVRAYLQRIAAYDQQGPALNSILRLNEAALAEAARLDAEREAGNVRSQLHGIPILVKDNYNTSFMPTTGASVALAEFTPNSNAGQIDRLLAAGAIVLAKTNLHEFAYGITTISSLGGQTRNPYDHRRVPGGSSGGTAAAVAASFAAIGLGSDTCGSIRIPAAFNNLVGLRVSKGLSSIYGVMPLSHTQDVAGPLARTTEDLAIVLDIVSGMDSRDRATAVLQDYSLPQFQESLGTIAIDELRLGRLTAYMDSADGAVRRQIDQALEWFTAQGAEVIEIEIADLGQMISASGLIGHEFQTDLHDYLALFASAEMTHIDDIVDQGLYHEAVGGAMTRSQASVVNQQAYADAMAARTVLRTAVEAVLQEHELDALVYPPIAEQPVFIGNSQPGNNCSLSANSGLPAISIPVGFDAAGLPVGMELLGLYMADAELLAIAHAWELAQAPRQVPFATPALQAGRAPPVEAINRGVVIDASIQFQIETGFDRSRNILAYAIELDDENSADIYAVTLMIAEQGNAALHDPVIARLLGPQQSTASGEIFMSPDLRQAYLDQRLFLRVFAEGLPAEGRTEKLLP